MVVDKVSHTTYALSPYTHSWNYISTLALKYDIQHSLCNLLYQVVFIVQIGHYYDKRNYYYSHLTNFYLTKCEYYFCLNGFKRTTLINVEKSEA